MVELRLDAALRRRLDPSDVVQEAWVDVVGVFLSGAKQTTCRSTCGCG